MVVLLVQRLGRSLGFHSKLDNHHHHHGRRHDDDQHHPDEAVSASLEAFRSDIANGFNQLLLNSKHSSEILSLSNIHQYFEFLPIIKKAFAKLLVDIDYPVSKWEVAIVEDYLNYSLNLLNLLNSISSSLSHLGQARLFLSHALNLVENSPSLAIEKLKQIELGRSFHKDWIKENGKDGEERSSSGKEPAIHQALMILKSIGYSICGIVLYSLSTDNKPNPDLKKSIFEVFDSSLIGLDSSIWEDIREKGCLIKEMREVNEAVVCLVDSIVNKRSYFDEAEELGRKLEVLEKVVDGLGKEVDHLFAEVLAARNHLLDSIRKHQ